MLWMWTLLVAFAGECTSPDGAPVSDPSEAGRAHASAGRYALALPCFEAAVATTPELFDWVNLGSVHLDLGRRAYESGRDGRAHIDKSITYMAKAIAMGTAPGQIYTLQAGNLAQLGRFDEAKQLLLARLPDETAPALRDQILELLGRLAQQPPPMDGAAYETAYTKGSRALQPFLSVEEVSRADARTVRAAIADLRRAAAAHPTSWPSWWLIGKGHQLLDEHDEALVAFERAYTIHPAHPDVAREFVLTLLQLGRAGDAVASESAVTMHPTDASLLANHALVLLMRGDTAGARTWADKALAIAADDPVTRELSVLIDDVAAGKRSAPKRLP